MSEGTINREAGQGKVILTPDRQVLYDLGPDVNLWTTFCIIWTQAGSVKPPMMIKISYRGWKDFLF